jgi:hypothetical protein
MILNAKIMSMANDAPTAIHIGTTRSATMMGATTGLVSGGVVTDRRLMDTVTAQLSVALPSDSGYHLAGRRIMGM